MAHAKPRKRKSVADIDAEIARLKEQRRLLRIKSAERFSRIALDTGLADLEISDEEVANAFKALMGRFQGPASQPSGSPGAAPTPT